MKIIISSATLDSELFFDFFNSNPTFDPSKNTAVIMSVKGRMHPVDIHYLPQPTEDYISKTVETVLKIHQFEGAGDILVFLTGREDIDTVLSLIRDRLADLKTNRFELLLLPLYGGLSLQDQLKVFKPAESGYRKCILSTNIAEASVTIDGIVFVVDSGFVKIKAFDPQMCMENLITVPISQSSAQQRFYI